MASRSVIRNWLQRAQCRCFAASVQPQGSKELHEALQRIPTALIKAMQAGWFTITQVPGSGRGLLAIRDIPQGVDVLREWPLAAVPSTAVKHKVCYHCLVPVDGFSHMHPVSRARFCNSCVNQLDHNPVYDLEAIAQLQTFTELCQQQGIRFPLLAARMALQLLAAGTKPKETAATASQQKQQTPSQSGCMQDVQEAGLECNQQPAHVIQGTVSKDLPFLCFANVKQPYPEEWVEQWTALHNGLSKAAEHLITSKGTTSEQNTTPDTASSSDQSMQAAHQLLQQCGLTLDWYASILSRLHVNSFRVDTIVLPSFGGASGFDLASATAALLTGNSTEDVPSPASQTTASQQQSGRLSMTYPAEGGGTGSAVYTVASLVNHSCEPNLDVLFPLNNSLLALRTARDIGAGEQLTISYIDATQPVQQRKKELLYGYGFKCSCTLCLEELQMTTV